MPSPVLSEKAVKEIWLQKVLSVSYALLSMCLPSNNCHALTEFSGSVSPGQTVTCFSDPKLQCFVFFHESLVAAPYHVFSRE